MCSCYISITRRRREGKTNYRKRKAVILGKLPFISIFIGRKNILVQILSPQKRGDLSLASAHSRELIKFGWLASRKNTPAAYLTGLLTGLKAKARENVDKAVLYIGLKHFQYNSRITAVAKGLLDAGISLSIDEETLPSEDRLKGKHIADYATYLLESNKALYKERFSDMIGKGLNPESFPEHFEEIRKKLIEGFEVKKI